MVSGEVLDLNSHWSEDGAEIITSATLAVKEIAKGDVTGPTITIDCPGGWVDEIGQVVEEGPDLRVGEVALVFLDRQDGRWVLEARDDKISLGDRDHWDRTAHESLVNGIRVFASGRSAEVAGVPVASAILPAGKTLSVATVDSVRPNQEVGVDPYSYIIITGTNFGDGSGSSKVHFRTDCATGSWKEFQKSLSDEAVCFAEWSNTRIKFWPAGLRTGTIPVMSDISSGPVQVDNGEGYSASPNDSLNVKYNYMRWRWPDATANAGIEYWLDATSYPASYDTSVWRAKIAAAFAAWDNISDARLSFTYKGYANGASHSYTDGMNVILWGTPGSGATAKAFTKGNSSGSMIDCDIILSDTNTVLRTDTSFVREVITHEIGHLLGLGDLGGAADASNQRVMFIRAPSAWNYSAIDSDTQDGIKRVYGTWSGELSPELGVTVWPDTIRLSGNLTVPSADTLIMTDGGSLHGVLVPEGYAVKSTGGIITGNSNAVTVTQTVPQKTALYPAWQSYSPTPGYYLIRYGTSTGSYNSFYELVSNSTTSKVVTGLTNGTQYYLTVNGSSEFTNKPSVCRTDFDGDSGNIDYEDFFLLADHWGLSQGQGGYDQKYDLSGNKTVDTPDTVVFDSDFGKNCVTQVPKLGMGLLALEGRNGDGQADLQVERVDGELVVCVRIRNLSEVSGLGFALDYDPATLTLTRIEDLPRAFSRQGEEAYLTAESNQSGRLMAAVALKRGYEPLNDPDLTVTIHFKVFGEGTGDSPVALSEAVVADGNRTVDRLVGGAAGGQGREAGDTGEYGLETQPNPFNPSTAISFSLPFEGKVTLEVYDVLGQLVRTLMADELQVAGRHTVVWDGKNQSAVAVSSGTYLVRLRAGDRVQSQKIALVR